MEKATVSKTGFLYHASRPLSIKHPVFNNLSRLHSSRSPPFAHTLPMYVPSHQIQVLAFMQHAEEEVATPKSPYPEARHQLSGFWRDGFNQAGFSPRLHDV
jgi:hypothetical protein